MPPVALVVSFELLMFITRRAIAARVARLAGATTTNDSTIVAATVRVQGDQATTPSMVAATNDRPALPATTADQPATRTADRATNDDRATVTANDRQVTSTSTRGATYRKVRELYQDGMTVAAEIARVLGVSSSYAQRTLRQVKADLAHQAATTRDGRTAATDERADQTSGDREDQQAARSHDDQATSDREQAARSYDEQATTAERPNETTTRATTNGNGRATTTGDRHLSLIRDQQADRGEVPSR